MNNAERISNTRPEPHALFKSWSPDQVAECMDGVGDLYSVLWSLVPRTRPYDIEDNGPHDVIGVGSLAESWHLLTPDQAAALNHIAIAHAELWA